MLLVRFKRSLKYQCGPFRSPCVERSAGVCVFEHALPWSIAFEVIGVELDPLDHSSPCQTNNRPVVAGASSSLRLPAITHVRRTAGENEILPIPVVHVAARHHEAAVPDRGEIDLTS